MIYLCENWIKFQLSKFSYPLLIIDTHWLYTLVYANGKYFILKYWSCWWPFNLAIQTQRLFYRIRIQALEVVFYMYICSSSIPYVRVTWAQYFCDLFIFLSKKLNFRRMQRKHEPNIETLARSVLICLLTLKCSENIVLHKSWSTEPSF